MVQPEVQRLAPAAAQGAGRALFDSWAFDDCGAVRDLHALAAQAVGAAAAVAHDPTVSGQDRLAASVEARRGLEIAARAKESSDEGRRSWRRELLTGALWITGAGVVLAFLRSRL